MRHNYYNFLPDPDKVEVKALNRSIEVNWKVSYTMQFTVLSVLLKIVIKILSIVLFSYQGRVIITSSLP
jgi:hypothetical protein